MVTNDKTVVNIIHIINLIYFLKKQLFSIILYINYSLFAVVFHQFYYWEANLQIIKILGKLIKIIKVSLATRNNQLNIKPIEL